MNGRLINTGVPVVPVEFVAYTYSQASSGTSLLVLPVPSGVNAGDVMVVTAIMNNATYAGFNLPGWTTVTTARYTAWGSVGLAIYSKIATATEPSSYSMPLYSADATAVMSAYRNASTYGASVKQGGTSAATVSVPSMIAQKGDMAVRVFGLDKSNQQATSWSSGMTLIHPQDWFTNPNAHFYEPVTANGETGTRSCSFSGANYRAGGGVIIKHA